LVWLKFNRRSGFEIQTVRFFISEPDRRLRLEIQTEPKAEPKTAVKKVCADAIEKEKFFIFTAHHLPLSFSSLLAIAIRSSRHQSPSLTTLLNLTL
jgi:hypothetical protein